MFRVFRSAWCSKRLRKLDPCEQRRIKKFENSLKVKPYSGKPLGYRFFREKKFDGKRLIFLVYDEHKAVFLVTITDKKAQREEIEIIRHNLDKCKEELINAFKLLLYFPEECLLCLLRYLLEALYLPSLSSLVQHIPFLVLLFVS